MIVPQPEVLVAISSKYENIEFVQTAIEASLFLLALDEETSFQIGLAVREAVANAIEHGNSEDADKRVEVRCRCENERVVVQVRDEGEGFDLENVPDPLEPNNLLNTSGRGILFMNEFMDEIDYTFGADGGTMVTMKKSITLAPKVARPIEEE